MNFIRKIINDAAITTWRKHLASLQSESAEIHARARKSMDAGNEALNAAQSRYYSTYSDADLEKWIQAKIRASVAFDLNQQFSTHMRDFIGSRIDGLLFRAAISSTRFALESKFRDIVADDAARAEDVGAPVESSQALDEIDRRLRTVEAAESYLTRSDWTNAIGSLESALAEKS